MGLQLRNLAGNVLVVGFEGIELPRELHEALSEDALGGVILFKRNIESAEQVRELNARVRKASLLTPLISVDQEGGRVARLGAPVVQLPAMRALARLKRPQLTKDAAELLGAQLKALGFNLDFAPVLDVDTNPDNPVIGDRSFADNPETVIEHALAFAKGLAASGIIACGKHFPGHGDTYLDSHLTLPTIEHDLKRMRAIELAPFAAAKALPALMTAHVVYKVLDAERPATLSSKLIRDLLRKELQYEGVVFSDDLEMKAVSEKWGVVDAGVQAIAAGCDALLVCSDWERAFELRTALEREAENSAAFRTRLEEAAGRVLELRRSIGASRGGQDPFEGEQALRVSAELESALA